MSSISKLPPLWKDGPPRRRVEIDVSSPALPVAALERLLTGTGTSSQADEVWWALHRRPGSERSQNSWGMFPFTHARFRCWYQRRLCLSGVGLRERVLEVGDAALLVQAACVLPLVPLGWFVLLMLS